MAEINNAAVLEFLQAKFADKIVSTEEPYGLLTLSTTTEAIIPMMTALRDDKDMQFVFLTDVCGVHYPDQAKPIGVIYHLHSLVHNVRLRLKVFLEESNLHIPTATTVYKSANWMERETYDFFGIIFDGHPDLRRILNVDDMVVFPMRKEHPLEDPNRKDKKDEYFGR